jgi:hypothetical protein
MRINVYQEYWGKQQLTLPTSSIGEEYLFFKKSIPIRHQGVIIKILCVNRRLF